MSRSHQGRDIYFLAHSWYIMKTNHNLKMFTFGKQVPTSQINWKAHPDFSKGETASGANFGVITDGRTADHRSKWASYRPRCNRFGLLNSVLPSAVFPRRLIEPGLHKSLPILMEMAIWNHIISLPHDWNNPTSPKINQQNMKYLF